MDFFIDNNLSKQLADGMAAFGESVIHLKDRFDADEDDEVWLSAIGEDGLFLITRDDRIRYRPEIWSRVVDWDVIRRRPSDRRYPPARPALHR